MTTGTLARGRAAWTSAREDPLLRSSTFLFLTSVVTAVLGFAFWAIAARLYSAADIGAASALLSAISLLSYLSLVGLNNLVIVRSADLRRSTLFATALAVVGVLGITGAVLYLLAVRWVSPPLGAVLASPLMVAFFALASWGAAVNVLTDSVFVARNAAHLNLWLNAFLQGAVRLSCLVGVAALGATGLVLSTGLAVAVTGVASLAVIRRSFGIPIRARPRRADVEGALPFVAGTYVSSLLYLVPQIVVPLVLVHEAGREANAYYFIAFQIGYLLYASADAVGQSVFAQAAGATGRGALLRRSALVLGSVTLLGIAVSELLAEPLLRLFGAGYVEHSLGPLRALLAAGAVVALNVWSSFVLRVLGRIRLLVLANVAHAGVTIVLTACWAQRGPLWVALAWTLGNLSAALVACPALVRRGRRPPVPQEEP